MVCVSRSWDDVLSSAAVYQVLSPNPHPQYTNKRSKTVPTNIPPLPSSYAADPQAWLDALPFPPAANVHVRLASLASDPVFVRKLYARVDKDGVRALGRVARKPVEAQAGSVEERLPAEAWVEEKWTPHLSLL